MCHLVQKDIDQINNIVTSLKNSNKFQIYNPKYNVLCCFFNDDFELIGYNNTKNINSQIPIQLHAELDAMKKLEYKISKKMTLNCLVLRYTQYKYCCNSRPCYYCAKKLSEFYKCKIKNVYYFEDEELKKQSINELIQENSLTNLSSGFKFRMNMMKNREETQTLVLRGNTLKGTK